MTKKRKFVYSISYQNCHEKNSPNIFDFYYKLMCVC